MVANNRMKKNLVICIILAAVVAHTPVKAQYYRLRSVEGKEVRVHIVALPHELRVSCLHDTLLLYEYFGDYHATVLNASFLQITYAVRGGSGLGPENIAILAGRDGHLRQALLLTSSFEAVGFKYHHTGHYVLQVGYHSGQTFDPYYFFKVYQPDLAIKTLPLRHTHSMFKAE
jgi:hypothetical protein